MPERFHPSEGDYVCELRRHDRVSEITLGGELDLAVLPRLNSALRAALEFAPTDALVLDLTAVTFADSSALHWLIWARRHAVAAGAGFDVTTAPRVMRDLLAFSGLEQYLSA
jgi:anti-anti-sigma factor